MTVNDVPENQTLFLIFPLRSCVALNRSGKLKFSQAAAVLPIYQLSDLEAPIYKRTEKSQLQLESLQFVFWTCMFLNNTKISGICFKQDIQINKYLF